MKMLRSLAAITAAIFFATSTIAEDAKPAEWLFVHTASTAEMTSDTTLVMPVTREIFAFTDRPNRRHDYITAHAFVSLWDEDGDDTFKADPPNAVLTWIDGDDVKEAEVLITNATIIHYGRAITYDVKVETGEWSVGQISGASFFIDSQRPPPPHGGGRDTDSGPGSRPPVMMGPGARDK
ncbi:MAG: hypothetical protein HN551_13965 [Tateyamaria sp.]|jgi:hypothetical protein|nr:hypothetical protein [Tateyamaria sp.]MBT6342965.1 hypothetical protein [Tateyamaria sp.]MBT7448193.1 hypothetical protein [Tateyamaria sp.]MBT7802339.1 hypothetical protein [Tateyamaria sp.]